MTLTTAEVAAELRCSSCTVRRKARALRLGFNLGGRAGWRFSQADVDTLKRSMQPAPIPTRRRRRAA